jgi:hypothetical protein
MMIDLQESIKAAEELLTGLRALHGMEIEGDATGRAAREHRSQLSIRLQWLAHTADAVRVTLTGYNLSLRDREQGRESSTGDQAADLPAPPRASVLDPFGRGAQH